MLAVSPHSVRPEVPQSLSSPRRIAAAVERLRHKHSRAVRDCGAVFGVDSAITAALSARVDALARAACLDDVERGVGSGSCSIAGGRLLHDLAGLPRAVERLHALLCWSLAVCQCVEAENRDAAAVSVHLAGMLGEVERINAALQLVEHGAEDDEPGPAGASIIAA